MMVRFSTKAYTLQADNAGFPPDRIHPAETNAGKQQTESHQDESPSGFHAFQAQEHQHDIRRIVAGSGTIQTSVLPFLHKFVLIREDHIGMGCDDVK